MGDIYQIDINKLLVAFVVNFIKLYYQEAMTKFKHSVSLHLNYANFALTVLHQPFTCMNIIRQMSKFNLGWLYQINTKMNEMYLTLLLEKSLKTIKLSKAVTNSRDWV